MRTIRAVRHTVRGTRRAEREVESWAATAIVAMVLLVAVAAVLAVFLIPSLLGGLLWLAGTVTGGERGVHFKRRGAIIAGWPWRGLSKAINGR